MMETRRSATAARLGALGALGVAGGVVLLWALFVWAGIRAGTGGLDVVHSRLIWLTTLMPAIALVAIHVALARQLFAEARRLRTRS